MIVMFHSDSLAVWNSSWGMPEHDYWRAHILDSKSVPFDAQDLSG